MQGDYRKAPADVNAKLCAQAIGNEIVIEDCPADRLNPEMDKLSRDISALAKTAEDTLVYAMFPDIGKTFLEQREQETLQLEALLSAEMATEIKASITGTVSSAYIQKGDRITPAETLIKIKEIES